MKLRNKKTGEIYDMWHICIGGEEITSVKQFNDTFEDYKPTEPLIKDEEVRKAVRAWAEANGEDGETRLKYNGGNNSLTTETDCIEFCCWASLCELKHGEEYTIAELCGEEEE